MEPDEIAGNVFGRVWNFCKNNYDDTLECLTNHSPDELPNFINSYLTNEEDEAIQNADQNFWESLKKEYEKLWTEEITRELRDYLGDTLELLAESIIQSYEIDSAIRARHLKAYAKILDEFGDAIKQALQDGKPLSEQKLFDWYIKLGDSAFAVSNYNYYEEIGYLTSLYDLLDDNAKLEVLSTLLDAVADVLWDIEEKYLPELEALTNNNS